MDVDDEKLESWAERDFQVSADFKIATRVGANESRAVAWCGGMNNELSFEPSFCC
jgi:hypothetical protein